MKQANLFLPDYTDISNTNDIKIITNIPMTLRSSLTTNVFIITISWTTIKMRRRRRGSEEDEKEEKEKCSN